MIYDENTYYCFAEIEKERRRLLRASKQVDVTDFGTGKSGTRRLRDVASVSLMPARDAQMLFRLVNYMHPKTVVELGTSLGVTTSYLRKAAGKEGRVYSFEGSKALIDEARKVWKSVGCKNIEVVEGNIDDTLERFLQGMESVDFALIDANHGYEPTIRYFDLLADKCAQGSVIALDDIHYSREMGRAWEQIKRDSRVVTTMDFYDMGLVFFNKQYLRKHYKLRF